MPGRTLLSEIDSIDPRYGPNRTEMVRRRVVLRETLNRFANADPPKQYPWLPSIAPQRLSGSTSTQKVLPE